MELLSLIAVLLVVGIVLYFFPIDPTIKNVILCVILVAVVVTVLHGFGAFSGWRTRW